MSNNPSRKRKQRETSACQPCRQRKVRCDSTRPICQTCARRDIPCSYLEPPTVSPLFNTDRPSKRLFSRQDDDGTVCYNGVNAMGVLTTQPQPTAPSEEQFFGDSSVASLLQGISGSSETNTSKPNQKRLDGDQHQRPTSVQSLFSPVVRFQFEDFSLPPRALADHLLDCYWAGVHTLYPFIHRPTFQQGYSRLWSAPHDNNTSEQDPNNTGLGSPSSPPIVFYCALNAMFALGCHKGEVFLQRSNKLLRQVDLLDHGDLSLVQALLANAHYLQSTLYADRCWNTIGLACRVAEGIGLHSTDHDNRWTYAELQTRRCVWHACVMMDVSASMALGRPSMISRHHRVPLPDSLGEHITGDPTPRVDLFFNLNMTLFYILGDILGTIYEPHRASRAGPQRDPRPNLEFTAHINEIEKSLLLFYSDLPPSLRWEGVDRRQPGDMQMSRKSNILRARYLHLKILLYRPMLTHLYRCHQQRPRPSCLSNLEDPHSSAYLRIIEDCSYKCVDAAEQLVSFLAITGEECRPIWWYSVLYMFTAGVVLIFANLCPQVTDQFPPSALGNAWKDCLEFLEEKVVSSSGARKCAHDLRRAAYLAGSNEHASTQVSDRKQAPEGIGDFPVANVDSAHGVSDSFESQGWWDDSFLTDLLWDDFITTIPLYF
ncbi:fungal-specific transcription factor domain-containing protein [Aspergillus ambiguus]|uniref:transcription factor domain-containing protein n=1 Tax=Aspergillus ambiguus TaxID=176160 RepID=UPI003CCD5665